MTNSRKDEELKEYAKKKIRKRILKIIGGIVTSSFFLISALLIIIVVVIGSSLQTFSTATDYTCFSAEVEEWRTMVENTCEDYGIEYYSDLVLAIMQCETGGNGTRDIMYSSDKSSNTIYGHNRGDIESASYSIVCGVSEIKDLLDLCNVTDLNDTANLSILYQAYEYDRGYIDYAYENGGYSTYSAQEYADQIEDSWISDRDATFAVKVAMYMELLTGGIREFNYPLSIYTVLKDYSEDYSGKIFGGVYRQIVMSSTEGTVTEVIENEYYSNVTIVYNDYELHYNYITNVNVRVGQTVKAGTTIGMVYYFEEYDSYGFEFLIMQNGEYLNPNDYLGKLYVEKQELDQDSIDEGVAIAEYASVCIDVLQYEDGGSDASGCDRIGFIHNVYSNFLSYDEDYFDLPTDSYESLINCKYVTYSLDQEAYIRPQIMYEGDVIIYKDDEGNYIDAAIYIGNSRVIHMTTDGPVKDFYNYSTPAVLIRLVGQHTDGMTWPIPGYTRDDISSPFEPERVNPVTGVTEQHKGTDIAAPTGTEVVAAADGEVIEAGYNDSCGYHVIIDHGDGKITYYYHSSELRVSTGDTVTAGQVIMLVGSSGQATGPHLHFGLTVDGEWVDPMDYSYIGE